MGALREAMNATTRLRGATRAPTCKWCTRFPVPCTSRICYLRLSGTARACVDRLRAGGGDGCKRLRSCVRVWWAIAVLDLHTHWLTFFRSLCPPATCGLLQPHLFSTRSPRLLRAAPSPHSPRPARRFAMIINSSGLQPAASPNSPRSRGRLARVGQDLAVGFAGEVGVSSPLSTSRRTRRSSTDDGPHFDPANDDPLLEEVRRGEKRRYSCAICYYVPSVVMRRGARRP